MRLAQEKQKTGQKTLQEEIEEELSSKKVKNEKELLKEKEELYLKSLNGGRRKSKSAAASRPDHSQSSRSDYSQSSRSDYSQSSSSLGHPSKRPPINDHPPRREEAPRRVEPAREAARREDFRTSQYRPEHKMRDLPPISQTYRRETTTKDDGRGLESTLNSKPGNLASKIASLSKEEILSALSKEELLALAKAADSKVKKEKKSVKVKDEYSPRAANRYDEYSPSEYRPDEYRPEEYRPKGSSSYKPSKEVYVPTKIKNGRLSDDEYDPVSNYKVSKEDMLKRPKPVTPSKPAAPSKAIAPPKPAAPAKLFDIDSLTPEEIEKIRKERMEKQKRAAEAAARLPTRDQATSSAAGKFKQPVKPTHSNQTSHSTNPSHSRATMDRPRSAYSARDLPPIGVTYRRGDYPSSSAYYKNYYEEDDYEEDEEDDDMRDFIDDGDYGSMQQEEVSKTIHTLFPTNRHRNTRYVFSDDEVEEEDSYEKLMEEEERSARIAMAEDALEERRNRERKKRKEEARRKGVSVSSEEDDSD